jgi:chromosome segregation ATPase
MSDDEKPSSEIEGLRSWLREFKGSSRKRKKEESGGQTKERGQRVTVLEEENASLKEENTGLRQRVEQLNGEVAQAKEAKDKAENELKERPKVFQTLWEEYTPTWKIALALLIGGGVGASILYFVRLIWV